jgi:AraC-like DNA-binding protein
MAKISDADIEILRRRRGYWVAEAERYVTECQDLRTSVRASELAQRLNLSPTQLAREFREAVGTNVGDFLKERQLDLAKTLLITTELSAARIALESGFGTPRSFFRAFRRVYGMTPNDYRSWALGESAD